jgi:hypothetical protein
MEKTAMTALHGPRCALTPVPAGNDRGRYGWPAPIARTDVDVTRPARGGPAV